MSAVTKSPLLPELLKVQYSDINLCLGLDLAEYLNPKYVNKTISLHEVLENLGFEAALWTLCNFDEWRLKRLGLAVYVIHQEYASLMRGCNRFGWHCYSNSNYSVGRVRPEGILAVTYLIPNEALMDYIKLASDTDNAKRYYIEKTAPQAEIFQDLLRNKASPTSLLALVKASATLKVSENLSEGWGLGYKMLLERVKAKLDICYPLARDLLKP